MAKRRRERDLRREVVRRHDTQRREQRVSDDSAASGKVRVQYEIGDQGEVLRHLVRLYTGPLAGLNEVVTNSADAYREAKISDGKIYIHVSRKPKLTIMVEDFSHGIPRKDLTDLPRRVAASGKRELQDPTVVGSKGIGLFGALAVGGRAEIRSRHRESKDTWLLTLDYAHLDEGAEVEPDSASRQLPGTHVTIHDIPETNQKSLTVPRIVKYIAEQKREALRQGLFEIYVIDDEKKEKTQVKAAVFKGIPLGVHEERTSFGQVVFDLFLYPTPGDHVADVIGKGGNRILSDLSQIDSFKNDVWQSGQLEGTITFVHLESTTGRGGIFHDRKYFPAFVGAVRKLEPDLRRDIEKYRQEAAQKLSGKINEALRKIYQQVLSELPDEAPFPTKTAVTHPAGEEIEGTPTWEQGEVPEDRMEDGDRRRRAPSEKTEPAIDQLTPGRTRGKWRRYPIFYPDAAMPPDGPRSRFAEAAGAIYLASQHQDYLSVIHAQKSGEWRPMLVYLLGLLWKEYLRALDPIDELRRQPDDLVGYVTKSQKYIPARI